MIRLLKLINRYSPLDTEAEAALSNNLIIENYKKNEYVLKEGEFCRKVWFINHGFVRRFYLHEGKEITVWLHAEDEMFTSMHSYFMNQPSTEYIQACEDTELYSVTQSGSKNLSKFAQFDKFSKLYLEEQFSHLDEILKKFSVMTAEEKYQTLIKLAPKTIQRAKQKHIASVMGVTPETLSRIRSQKK